MKLKGTKNNKRINKKCLFCNKLFITSRADSKWCSKKCSDKNNYKKHPDTIYNSNKKWRKENYEKYRENDRKWRNEYQKLERVKEIRRLRDFARYSLRERILERDKNKCIMCGSLQKLELHHKSYTRNEKDIITICRKCHLKIHKEVI